MLAAMPERQRWCLALTAALVAACGTRDRDERPAAAPAPPPAPVRAEAAPPPEEPEPEPAPVVAAGLPAACDEAVGALAAGGEAAWRALPRECRGGAWYLAGAVLLRSGAATLDHDGAALATPRDALERGLAAAPSDPALLAYVAYVGRVQPDDAPRLPADACARARAAAADDEAALVAYVCAHATLATGAVEDAATAFAAIAEPPYPDAGVCRVEALLAAGHERAARAAAHDARALLERHRGRAGVTDDDLARLADALGRVRSRG